MKVRYDPEGDAMYIRLIDGPVHDTDEVEEGIIVDYDSEGNAMSVEILDAAKRFRDAENTEALTKLVDAISHKVA